MKNISDMLRTGNLTPKERILLCIHDEINELQTGVSSLTESDVLAIAGTWKPKNQFESKEYNRYYHTWEVIRLLKIDIQTTYLNAIIEINTADKLLIYALHEKNGNLKKVLEDTLSRESKEKALSLILKNTGLDYDTLIHTLTFENLSPEMKADILALDPDAKTSPEYLNEEEKLSEICKGKTKLSDEDCENITAAIMDSITWEYMKYIADKRLRISSVLFHGYFASIPLLTFTKKLAVKFKLEYDNEDQMKEKVHEIPNLQHEFKTVIREEITDGLLTKDYTSLCNSKEHGTCNGVDTKLKHYKVIENWIIEKNKTKAYLQKYIDDGKLVLEKRYKELFNIRKYFNSISGESLYYLDDGPKFVTDYKKQVDEMMILGHVVQTIHEKNFMKYYSEILEFNELLRQCSPLLEIDLLFYSSEYLDTLKVQIGVINQQIRMLCDKLEGDSYLVEDTRFHIELYLPYTELDLENVAPTTNASIDSAHKRLTELWGQEIFKDNLFLSN